MKNLFTLFLIMVTFTSNAQTDCNPVTITNVEREGIGNRITWTIPTGGEEVIISQGGNYMDYSTGDSEDFGVYHRFTSEELAAINGGILTQVVFVPAKAAWQTEFGHTFTIQIYKGGVWGEAGNRNPGNLLASKELNNANLLPNQENTITLGTPVTIDASQELWIGYFCTNIDSIHGFDSGGCDTGPRKDGFGNIVFYQNQWQTLYEINPSGVDVNWVIKGKVQTSEGISVNIYFNDIQIATDISGTTYLHDNPTGEEHCYKVEVNCLEGGVSLLSNEFCTTVGINDNEQIAKFTLYPNPAKEELTIEWTSGRVGKIEVFDVYGRKQKVEGRKQKAEETMVINISNLPAGVYFVRLTDGLRGAVQKFIKE